MNQVHVEGMRARSAGLGRQSNPHPAGSGPFDDWRSGWEMMDQQIGHVLGNAEGMVNGLARLRMKAEPAPRTARAAKQPELAGVSP
jgi:hypothetical protein